MRAPRVILACVGVAIGILIASAWIASSGSRRWAPLDPPTAEGTAGQHRESAVLDVAHVGEAPAAGSTREVPPAPGIHGRLTDASTGLPLAGWKIRLEHRPDPSPFVSVQIEASRPRYSKGVVELPTLQVVRIGNENFEVSPNKGGAQDAASTSSSAADPNVAAVNGENVRLQLFAALAAARTVQARAAQTAVAPTSPDATTPEPAPVQEAESEETKSAATDASSAPAASETNANPITFRFETTDLKIHPAPDALDALARVTLERAAAAQNDANVQVFDQLLMRNRLSAELRFADVLERQFGVPVERAEPSIVQAECVTDADGRFDLPCPDHDDAWLALEPRPPLYPDSNRYPLHEAADACARFIEWKTRPVERAVLHARVLDEATGEPVPWLDVVVTGIDGRETLTTDAEGKLASKKPLSTGPVRVSFRDGPTELESAHEMGKPKVVPVPCDRPTAVLDTSGEELVFHVAIGPTWRFTLPNGIEPELVVARVRGLVSRGAHDAAELDGDWHPVRHEDEWFVRAPVPVRAAPGDSPVLDVWLQDLHWAHLELQRLEGRGERIELPLALGARLHGRVLGDDDAAVAGARVELVGRDGAVLDVTTSNDDGSWQFVGIDPAAFSRVQVAPGGATRSASLPLHAGDDRELDVTLGAQPR